MTLRGSAMRSVPVVQRNDWGQSLADPDRAWGRATALPGGEPASAAKLMGWLDNRLSGGPGIAAAHAANAPGLAASGKVRLDPLAAATRAVDSSGT